MTGAEVFATPVQGRGAGGDVLLSRKLHRHQRHRGSRNSQLRWPNRGIDVRRRGRLLACYRRGDCLLRHRRPRLHAHDHEYRRGCRGAHSSAGAGQQHADRGRRPRGVRADHLSAADHNRDEEVRKAIDRAGPCLGIRLVRIPQSEVGCARPGAPRFPRRGGSRPIHRSGKAEGLLREGQISHRIPCLSLCKRHAKGGRTDQQV